MKLTKNLLFLTLLLISACKKESPVITGNEVATTPIPQQSVDERLINQLEGIIHPITDDDPLKWTNQEMQFLDKLADKKIIGLGEATHGTSEFFKAKHRIFQYLVEEHGFKVFAFEADFGESIFINKAIQEGRAENIKGLMFEYMQFWTWRTEEVLDLLVWMANYNKDKAPEDKVHYMGVDCQYNSFNTQRAIDYIQKHDKELFEKADKTLIQIREKTTQYYNQDIILDEVLHTTLTEELAAIVATNESKEAELIAASSLKEYEFQKRLLATIQQAFEVSYTYKTQGFNVNLRDTYMAENTMWLHDTYFDKAKVVLWAHNYHVSRTNNGPATGKVISNNFGDNYHAIGFTFATGKFTARDNGANNELKELSIYSTPLHNSINSVFTQVAPSNFVVNLFDLSAQAQWTSLFLSGDASILSIGSGYNSSQPENYYSPFSAAHYHDLIHIDQTTAAIQLRQ